VSFREIRSFCLHVDDNDALSRVIAMADSSNISEVYLYHCCDSCASAWVQRMLMLM
jgi:hypothetical protein